MAHVTHHKQIEAFSLNEIDDCRHCMTSDDVRGDPCGLGLSLALRTGDDRLKAMLGICLFLNHFVDAGWDSAATPRPRSCAVRNHAAWQG